MFDSLSDRIRQDDGPPARRQVLIQWAAVAGIVIALFGGLYLVLQHLEG